MEEEIGIIDNRQKMTKNRNVFLFGAGAVLAWNGPKTKCAGKQNSNEKQKTEGKSHPCCLTHLVLNNGFKSKDGEFITKEIYDALLENGFSEEDINFETIIDVIEELSGYFAPYSDTTNVSLLFPFIKKQSLLEKISNFDVMIRGKSFELIIPDEHDLPTLKNSGNSTPKQYFFQLLVARLLDEITSWVSAYSYYSNGIKSVVENEKNKHKNDNFYNWIKTLQDQGSVNRLYTLNYDRLFRIILGNRGMDVFEGFNTSYPLNADERVKPSTSRILSDMDSVVHYNLHGSSFWEVRQESHHDHSDFRCLLTANPQFATNQTVQVSKQMENGKNIVLNNIITGHQKTQKTALSPYRQMMSSFDFDCSRANHIYIVGYSFGDEHINEVIKSSLEDSDDMKITIIDPGFIQSNMDRKLSKIFLTPEFINCRRQKSADLYCFYKNRINVITKKFQDFLDKPF